MNDNRRNTPKPTGFGEAVLWGECAAVNANITKKTSNQDLKNLEKKTH